MSASELPVRRRRGRIGAPGASGRARTWDGGGEEGEEEEELPPTVKAELKKVETTVKQLAKIQMELAKTYIELLLVDEAAKEQKLEALRGCAVQPRITRIFSSFCHVLNKKLEKSFRDVQLSVAILS